MSWSGRCARAPGCSPPWRSPRRPAPPIRGSARGWLPSIRERGVITRLLRGVALQVSPPFVITEAEIARIAEVFTAAFDAAVR